MQKTNADIYRNPYGHDVWTEAYDCGKSEADCTRECMKSKRELDLWSRSWGKVYVLSGDTTQFASFAGERVKVIGEQTGNSVAVQSITSAP